MVFLSGCVLLNWGIGLKYMISARDPGYGPIALGAL